MTVQLKIQARRQILPENVFRVQMDVIEAIDIDFDVFVFNVLDDGFSHIATVYDLETWPTTKDAALEAGLQSYRGRGVELNFSSPLEATTFETNATYRLRVLKNHWQEVLDEYEDSSIITIV